MDQIFFSFLGFCDKRPSYEKSLIHYCIMLPFWCYIKGSCSVLHVGMFSLGLQFLQAAHRVSVYRIHPAHVSRTAWLIHVQLRPTGRLVKLSELFCHQPVKFIKIYINNRKTGLLSGLKKKKKRFYTGSLTVKKRAQGIRSLQPRVHSNGLVVSGTQGARVTLIITLSRFSKRPNVQFH